jgi:flagellar hook assembly protein FlgD
VELGAHFQKLKGIMYYSFSNYKLVPRKDDDFVGYTTAVREENSNPVSFSLEQNYPNPFNPSTRIVYSIPKASNVTLNIYNVLGQQVKTLIHETQSQGTYTVTFNATSLPSGIYFYRIDAGDYNQVKKMILLK